MAKQDIVVIGGSAGSGSVLKQIVSGLPEDIDASFFIATHVPPTSDYLAAALARVSTIPVIPAADGHPVERGRVYVAVPNQHMLLVDGTIRLGDGPRENMARPAIDPLFRSAALAYGPRAIGVILSGMLNDGASGLRAIKTCGGTAIVQHPLDAAADQMPLAALETVDVDEVVAGENMARLLASVVMRDAGKMTDCPQSLLLEVEIAAGVRLGAKRLQEIADPAPLTCPECDGVLSEIRGERPLRYRCQIGHAQTAEVLDARKENIDDALRIAWRVMEERVTLVTRMAQDARDSGRTAVAELYDARAAEFDHYARVLRDAAVETLESTSAARSAEH